MSPLLVALALSSIDLTTDGCSSAKELRDEVRSRLGRDAEADRSASFAVVISRAGGSLEARLSTTTSEGLARRTFSSSDCRELIESVALAISITLDPGLLLAENPPRVEPPPPAAVEKVTPAPAPLVAVPPTPVQVSLALLGAAALGSSGPVTGTGGLSVGLGLGPWWLGLEGRIELPVRYSSSLGQTISAFSTVGTLAPGWQHRWVRLSLPVSVGALLVTGGGSRPVRDSRPLVLAGFEATFRWELGSVVVLEPFVRAQLVATRISVLAGTRTAWVTWPVVLVGGLAVRFQFPAGR